MDLKLLFTLYYNLYCKNTSIFSIRMLSTCSNSYASYINLNNNKMKMAF